MALLTSRRLRLLPPSWVLAFGCAAFPPGRGMAQAAQPSLEQQVKAAYLLNFTRYVDWPAGAFARPDDPVSLCVFGADEFGEVVKRTVEGRRSRGRTVRVLHPDTPEQAERCHVAFVGGAGRASGEWMDALRGAPTLTVGDDQRFLKQGGMIAFVIVNQTVRFEIDAEAARRAGLQISSRVLALATRLHHEGRER